MSLLVPFSGVRLRFAATAIVLASLASPAAALAKGRRPATTPGQQPPAQKQQQPPLTTPQPEPTPPAMQNEPQGQAPAAQVPTTPPSQLTASQPLIQFQ